MASVLRLFRIKAGREPRRQCVHRPSPLGVAQVPCRRAYRLLLRSGLEKAVSASPPPQPNVSPSQNPAPSLGLLASQRHSPVSNPCGSLPFRAPPRALAQSGCRFSGSPQSQAGRNSSALPMSGPGLTPLLDSAHRQCAPTHESSRCSGDSMRPTFSPPVEIVPTVLHRERRSPEEL